MEILSSVQSSLSSETTRVNGGDDDDSNVLIECRDVHKSFGRKQVLRGVSFKVSSLHINNFYLD